MRGEPRHIVIVGEAGVGKTRLLTHSGNLAGDDGTCALLGNCVASGSAGLPFAPFVQIEDVHWADAGSLGATLFILRSLRTEPISMLITVRADEVSRRHSLRAWLADVTRSADVERIDALSEPARRLIGAASVGGREIDHAELLQRLAQASY